MEGRSRCGYGDALVVISIQSPAKLIVTAGVAVDVKWSNALLADLNDLNGTMLMVGRCSQRRMRRRGSRDGHRSHAGESSSAKTSTLGRRST